MTLLENNLLIYDPPLYHQRHQRLRRTRKGFLRKNIFRRRKSTGAGSEF